MALRIRDFAGSNPPSNSTTISISGSVTILSKSVVTSSSGNDTSRALESDRTPTRWMTISLTRGLRPTGSVKILAVPVPTTPKPSKPILNNTVSLIPY